MNSTMRHAPRALNSVGIYLALSCLPLSLGGCGGAAHELAPVAGVVTLDGQPVPGARIVFEPLGTAGEAEAGPGSYATTDAEGRFELRSIHGDQGAVVGPHRVAISTFQGREDSRGILETVVAEQIPAAYQAQGSLQFEVPPEGAAQANFALTTN